MKHLMIAAVSGLAFLLSSQVIAADSEAGKKKAQEVCASCHGLDGNSPAPNFPKIGGQARTYIEKVLNDYKSGERKDPIMAGMTANLSKEDIENLAFYYSGQKGLVNKR
ncbi:c-type cytochrome [Nitrosomonas mobilis]|uniref:Cytochrome c, class IC:Cytochrome c, class I n=1 Tax=Nitrosomonas mobilis TaxID=51642 RepID=A0A1G5SJD8_9PROT|nr:cytochrome c [Nitrosomonas mobilis]SCZ86651.1 Cytochrome c, class IC:Cytochrome c, class I [Nitrosomonas mobilis]HNO74847.1 cytochrome c [Nitrosomonas mobilis]